MSDSAGTAPLVRAFVLQGPGAAMAVEWLHVHAQVEGVLEEQDAFVVWLPGALPELPRNPITVPLLTFWPELILPACDSRCA